MYYCKAARANAVGSLEVEWLSDWWPRQSCTLPCLSFIDLSFCGKVVYAAGLESKACYMCMFMFLCVANECE